MKKTISIDEAHLPESLFEATQVHNHLLSMHLNSEKTISAERKLILYSTFVFISSIFVIALHNRSSLMITYMMGIAASIGMILICISRQWIVDVELKRHNRLSSKGLMLEDRFNELSGIFSIYAKNTRNLARSTFFVTCAIPIFTFGLIGSTCLFLAILEFSVIGASIASSFLFFTSLAYLVSRFRCYNM